MGNHITTLVRKLVLVSPDCALARIEHERGLRKCQRFKEFFIDFEIVNSRNISADQVNTLGALDCDIED